MTNINENLQKMLSARYGRDMRQAIHDSIESMSNKIDNTLSDDNMNTVIDEQVRDYLSKNQVVSDDQVEKEVNGYFERNDIGDKINELLGEQYVTLEMFGAVGDGVADDTDAFANAIATGKEIRLMSKSYAINKRLSVENAIIIGTNQSKIIINTPSTYFNLDTTIKNVNFESSYYQIGFTDEQCGNVILENCNFNNTFTHFYNPNTVTVKNCNFIADDDVTEESSNLEFIHVANAQVACCEKITIEGCKFVNSPTDAFDIYPNGDHVDMSDCSFINCFSASEIKCGDDTSIKRHDVKFNNIYIELRPNCNGIRCYDQKFNNSENTPSATFNNITVLYKFNGDEKTGGIAIKAESCVIQINNLKVINSEEYFNAYPIGGNRKSKVFANNIYSKSKLIFYSVDTETELYLSNSFGYDITAKNLIANNCSLRTINNDTGTNISLNNCNISGNLFFYGGKMKVANCNLEKVRDKSSSGLCVISNSFTTEETIPSETDYLKLSGLYYA